MRIIVRSRVAFAAARRSYFTVGPAAGAAGYKQGAAAEAAGAVSRVFLRTIFRARGVRALFFFLRGRLAANGVRAGRGALRRGLRESLLYTL